MNNVNPILEMRNIRKEFPGVVALNDVSIEAYHGEVLGLVGENGAGKSTLMKILCGVYSSYEGEIILRGERCHFHNTRDAESAGVAMIHQELNLVPEMSVAENIFLGREPLTFLHLIDKGKMIHESRKLLGSLNAAIDPKARVEDLGIGSQQLVEIAKALSLNVQILAMDEPTSALTDREVEKLFEVIRKLRAEGNTIIYISHKIKEVLDITDRITVLRDGRYVGTEITKETDSKKIVNMMVGRDIDEFFHKSSREYARGVSHEKGGSDVPLLAVDNLSVPHPEHKGEWLLDSISFEVYPGEVVGIFGLMGAGRTELLNSVFGAYPIPRRGEVRVDGKLLRRGSPALSIENGLALVTEDRKAYGLVLEMSVEHNLTLASLTDFCRLQYINKRAEAKAADRSIKELSIVATGRRSSVTNLSGGNQQKVVLGKWLLTMPKVLLLDEPTRGIDVGGKSQIYILMDELANRGMGIVMVSSELPEILAMSDRVLVMWEGKLMGELSRNEATEEKIMTLATGGARVHDKLSSSRSPNGDYGSME